MPFFLAVLQCGAVDIDFICTITRSTDVIQEVEGVESLPRTGTPLVEYA